jgi:hypothetical protein
MARARRARKKKSTRRKSTKKSTRRRSTRRAAARRTRTRRPKRTTRRKKTKGLGLTRKAQRQILTVAAIVVGILILIALLQQGRHFVQVTWYGGEVGRNVVLGKVTSAAIGAAGRGTIHVQSYNTGKIYTFYTGMRTDYNIRGRYPVRGDSVKVYYINDRGYLKATYVSIR